MQRPRIKGYRLVSKFPYTKGEEGSDIAALDKLCDAIGKAEDAGLVTTSYGIPGEYLLYVEKHSLLAWGERTGC